jgi:hypothetical protein
MDHRPRLVGNRIDLQRHQRIRGTTLQCHCQIPQRAQAAADYPPDQCAEDRDDAQDRQQQPQCRIGGELASQAEGLADLDQVAIGQQRVHAPLLAQILDGDVSKLALERQWATAVREIDPSTVAIPYLHDDVLPGKRLAAAILAIPDRQRVLAQLVVEQSIDLASGTKVGGAAGPKAEQQQCRQQRQQQSGAQ